MNMSFLMYALRPLFGLRIDPCFTAALNTGDGICNAVDFRFDGENGVIDHIEKGLFIGFRAFRPQIVGMVVKGNVYSFRIISARDILSAANTSVKTKIL